MAFAENINGEKQRIIQEFVPGKQITLAHIIAKPNPDFYNKFGLIDQTGSVGIMTITPSEGAMIASDICTKAAKVKVGFVDRFNGSLVITGNASAVESSLREVMSVMGDPNTLGFAPAIITRT